MLDMTIGSRPTKTIQQSRRRKRVVPISRGSSVYRCYGNSSTAAMQPASGCDLLETLLDRRVRLVMSIASFFAPPSHGFGSRRDFLHRAGGGCGLLALAGLLDQQGLLAKTAVNPLAPRQG